MPEVIGHTADGREVIRHDPSEGCQFRCTTCGNWLYRQAEVRGHWALFSGGHSVFTDRKERVFHQTAEGLHRRDWPAPEADHTEQTEREKHE